MLEVVRFKGYLLINTPHLANLVEMPVQLNPHATWSDTHQDSSVVEVASWLLGMPVGLEANCIFVRTFQFLSLSSSSPLPTSLLYHLPLHFHTRKSGLDKHHSMVRANWNQGESRALDAIRNRVKPNYNADTP